MKSNNITKQTPYLDQIYQNLPRLLACFDTDPVSKSYGIGDRFYWAWCLIDFGNGTFQGAANGLASLLVNQLLPFNFSEDKILQRIDSIFIGANTLRRRDGSMEESFPYEGSFCVTALVAYDLLTAIEFLWDRLPKEKLEKYLQIVSPMISFILKTEETHAFVSNHLATAAAALYKWHKITGERSDRHALKILNRILQEQSEEGWYKEYYGADPGYQTLCMYYLADVLRMTNNEELKNSLVLAVKFIWYFAHPDGSFGGIYGSRNTRFFFPAGIEYLAKFVPEAAALAKFMRESILHQKVVTLNSIDPPNLVPMFNCYCWAAILKEENNEFSINIPCMEKRKFRKYFPDAGIFIDHGERHYTIISTKKGGVVYHFKDRNLTILDPGLIFESKKRNLYSTQNYIEHPEVKIEGDTMFVKSIIKRINKRLPKVWQFVILRIFNVTIMRFPSLREVIKRLLVDYFITGNNKNNGTNLRIIKLGYDLSIEDHPSPKPGLYLKKISQVFTTIHMASQGYWQLQDDL
jgi:hypothetical protein